MRQGLRVGLIFAGVACLAGCSTTKLHELNANIPTPLVEQYKQSTAPYVDQGMFWIPAVLRVRRSVSKTADGFHASELVGAGPLACLTLSGAAAEYDSQGLLQRHESANYLLWGVLMGQTSSRENVKGAWATRDTSKVLFGLFGYGSGSDKRRTLYVLYIPIGLSGAAPEEAAPPAPGTPEIVWYGPETPPMSPAMLPARPPTSPATAATPPARPPAPPAAPATPPAAPEAPPVAPLTPPAIAPSSGQS